jgi:hypothetical protein
LYFLSVGRSAFARDFALASDSFLGLTASSPYRFVQSNLSQKSSYEMPIKVAMFRRVKIVGRRRSRPVNWRAARGVACEGRRPIRTPT